MAPRATVLVPLYIYPLTEKTWQPLYDTIAALPDVDFAVIVNPASGPGWSPLPSLDYLREIPKLNSYPNVVTLGYIRILYCGKPIDDVRAEVETYALWSTHREWPGLGVAGIFLDETPNHWTEQRAHYLEATSRCIKAKCGIGDPKLIVHNAGTPPDTELGAQGPDVVVTCEEPYSRYRGPEVQRRLNEYHYDRIRSGYIISAVPLDEVASLTRELSRRGQYVFVTDLAEDMYESFGSSWNVFAWAMKAAA